MSKRMTVLLVLTVLIFGVAIGGKLFIGNMVNNFLDNMPVPPAVVSADEAKSDSWISSVTAVGTVAPEQGANLTTQVSGIVEKIYFDSGTEVKAGDLILSLDTATDQAELNVLKSAENLALLERDRVKALWQRNSISKSEFDTRQSQLEQATAQVAAQQARIEQKHLRAPFDGRLGIRQVNVGQFVNAGDPLIGLQALEKVYVDFTLPEQRFGEVRVGMMVTAQMDALAKQSFEGKITAIEPVIDSGTRNFNLQATFKNEEHLLHPGMFARLAMDVGEARDVVMVPRSAINFKPYGNSVFVITEAEEKNEQGEPVLTAKLRFVQTGESRGDYIAITEGLTVGEKVAISGLLKLRSGGTVIIDNSDAPKAQIAPTPENG